MTRNPETMVLGGLVILLVAVLLGVLFWTRGRSLGPTPEPEPLASTDRPEEIAPWVMEGRRLFSLWQERIERLDELKSRLSGMAQEIEQLRAEIGHIDEMRAQITRLVEESEQYRVERDRLHELLGRIGTLAQEATAWRSE